MTSITEEEAKFYAKKSGEWLRHHHRSYVFGDVGNIVRLAVAEYIANQDGKTLYPIEKTVDSH